MASKRRVSNQPIPRRTAADFVSSTIPPQSFFAGEYLRLSQDIQLLDRRFNEKGEAVVVAGHTIKVATPVEYDYDTDIIGVKYHKCHVTIDGVTYYLRLTDDQIEVVRPI